MKLMKVFDCQDMPDDLRHQFFEKERGGLGRGNRCYISWYIAANRDPTLTEQAVDEWLVSQGASGPPNEDSEGEHVLIKHWW